MSFEKVETLLQLCRESGLKLRTAESCTAGAVAALLASVTGASDVLDRGWITYSNQSKIDELGVSPELLSKHGAVSEAVVRAMASGGVRSGGDVSVDVACVALSGIAGPSGGTPDKPVGTVWMAVALPNGEVVAEKYIFQGSRIDIQRQAAEQAIVLLHQTLKQLMS